jgi:DNA-binding MarR family transcriptional regulator
VDEIAGSVTEPSPTVDGQGGESWGLLGAGADRLPVVWNVLELGGCHQTVTVTPDAALVLGIGDPARLTTPHRLRQSHARADGSGRAGLLREGVTDPLDERDGADLAAFERALGPAADVASAAFRAQDGWLDGVRAGLLALLEFFDTEPALARYLVVGSAVAGPRVLERRKEILGKVALLLDDERAPARAYPPPLTADAVASGVLGVLYARLSEPEPGVLAELAGPLMSFIVLPFAGVQAARRELRHTAEAAASPSAVSASVDLLGSGVRRGHRRELEVLRAIAGEPGLNSTELGLRAGIKDPAHVSRLMGRLVRLGLVENIPSPGRPGVKAWRLTRSGEQLHAEAGWDASTPVGVLAGLPEELADRLDYWGVSVLRAVGEQPWLTSSELAACAGVEPARITGLLAQLAQLGLVDSVREAHRKGAPKVWQITDLGRELDSAIEWGFPAPARSVALDLMWHSGGRLSEPAVAVLHTIAGESELSNGEIAQRVGVTDANRMSQLLARLARRGLIENTRTHGRENRWAPTAAGKELQKAIRQEAPTPVSRMVAFDALRDRGGRLNHRVVSVLDTIGDEPGLSNQEIAERIGIGSKAHTSNLLSRLARFGLIENQIAAPALFEANVWRLTISGRQLQAAVRRQNNNRHTAPSRGLQDMNPTGRRR